jgi:hypothetical protein
MSNFDLCILQHTRELCFTTIYIENITLYGSRGNLIDLIIDSLKSEYKVSDLENL